MIVGQPTRSALHADGCPRCGSRLYDVQGIVSGLITNHERRICVHCRKLYSAPQSPAASEASPTPVAPSAPADGPVVYVSNPVRCRCRHCQSPNPKVVRTVQRHDGTLRYHACEQCGQTSTSLESP